MKREKWSSRSAFVLAAIGSAVGLGNAWRFPGVVHANGGGAFLVVYLFAMLIMGWPLLMMEIAIGRKMQKGAPGTFRGINKKTEFIGWAAVSNAFFIATYYAIVLAWVLYMIVKSFSFGPLTGNPDAASNLFMNDVIQAGGITDFSIPWGMIIFAILSWGMIYWCIRKGTSSVGKVVKYTVFIPVIVLLVLAINGLCLPNAMEGMKAYLIPEWEALANPQIWIAAFGQVFYSMSIMMAIIIAYASFLPKDGNIIKDTLVIAASDVAVSFLAGVVLFTTLAGTGNLESMTSSGISTAFVVYPMALVKISSIPWINVAMAVLFYVTLFTLAIDSAFSIVEGVATAISDKFRVTKHNATKGVCIAAGIISILYITRGGINWLDIVDHWTNDVNLILVGVLETIAIGWCFKVSKVRDELNRTSEGFKIGKWFDIIVKYISPAILAGLFIWNLWIYFTTEGGYGNYPGWAQALGWAMSAVVLVSGFIIQLLVKNNKKIQEAEAQEPSWDEIVD